MKKYYKFEIDMKLMNILSGIICILLIILAYKCDTGYTELSTGKYSFIFYIGMILYFFLHEICHGIGYSLFVKDRKNIKYGIMLEKGVLYAMCQEEISKKGIIISLLFPLIFLSGLSSIIGLIFNLRFLIIYSVINLVGAIGDITMLFLIIKFPKDITYIDYDNVIGAYFISDKDLSNYKSIGMKFIETNKHDEKLINTSIKRIYISTISVIISLIILIFLIISFICALLFHRYI